MYKFEGRVTRLIGFSWQVSLFILLYTTNLSTGDKQPSKKERKLLQKIVDKTTIGDKLKESGSVPGPPLSEYEFLHQFEIQSSSRVGAMPDVVDSYGGAGLFEGDIVINDKDELAGLLGLISGRNAISGKNYLWPKGIVPYVLGKEFNSLQRRAIAAAMDQYHKLTCIRFVPFTNKAEHPNHLHIFKGKGCYSAVGRREMNEVQGLSLDARFHCFRREVIQHELMHSIGFWHEQSRPDRDKHIKIIRENILPGKETNFVMKMPNETTKLGLPYDYSSLMHYMHNQFAKHWSVSAIRPKDKRVNKKQLGNMQGFTDLDVEGINLLYKDECGKQDIVDSAKPTVQLNIKALCVIWAAAGECRRNSYFMMQTCKVACVPQQKRMIPWSASKQRHRIPWHASQHRRRIPLSAPLQRQSFQGVHPIRRIGLPGVKIGALHH